MVIRDMLPPEKRSMNPKIVPFWDCQNSASASPLMPGLGIWAPIR